MSNQSPQEKKLATNRVKARFRMIWSKRISSSRVVEDVTNHRDGHILKKHLASTQFFSYYVSIFGLFFIPFCVSCFYSSSSLLQSLIMGLAIWINFENLFWLNQFVIGQQNKQVVEQSKQRIFIALSLFLVIISFDIQEHWWLAMCLGLYFYSWLTFVYRDSPQSHFYDVNPADHQKNRSSLISHLAILTSLFTLFVWRSDQIAELLIFESLLLSQVPLTYNLISYWKSNLSSYNQETLRWFNSLIKHCAPALLMNLSTVLVAYSFNPIISTSFVCLIAIVLLYYVSYLAWFKESWERFQRNLESPLKTLAMSFIALCILGTGLLMLPWVTLGGRSLTFLEAAFTSVSASCITGLSIIDMSQMSLSGQFTTLLLIQIGGFGIILLSHIIYSFGQAMSGGKANHEKKNQAVRNLRIKSYLGDNHLSASFTASRLALYVISVELLSGMALSLCFLREGFPPLESLWRGFFTSISAFCNAGFALQSDSFVSLSTSTTMLFIISITVCLGGFGPTVIFELIDRYKYKTKAPLSLFSKIILWGSGSLFILPTLFFCWTEWNHAFVDLPPIDKLSNAFFHSTSLRTAGFNAVDLSKLSDSSWSLSLVLMLIGGSPLSTAGGIKVTTVVIALMSILPILQNRRAVIFSRSLRIRQSVQAYSTLMASLIIVLFTILLLQLNGEALTIKVIIFEVFSALGTVGLSMGGTGALSSFGLSVIMFCMFLGRIGPPVLFLLFLNTKTENLDKTYLGEDIQLS